MARRVVAAIALAALMAVPATAVAGPGGDVRGPRCADIVPDNPEAVSEAGYDGETQQVDAIMATAGPSCRFITYTLYVLDEAGDSTPIATMSVRGDGTNSYVTFFGVDVSENDDTIVCVYVTTSVGRGRHVFDRAPDTGCIELSSAGISPGGSNWR